MWRFWNLQAMVPVILIQIGIYTYNCRSEISVAVEAVTSEKLGG